METIEIRTWGPAFSLLLFETAKVAFHQDGFLLGNIIHRETTKVTDADHEILHKECIINVQSIIPCSTQFYFYNSAGQIDANKIKDMLGNRIHEVIGWYIHKPKHSTHSPKLALREKIIHKCLVREFDNPNFVCCLSSSTLSGNKSTHSFTQIFQRYSKGEFKNLPFHINNLTDPNSEFKYDDPVSTALKSIIEGGKKVKQPLNIRNVQKQVEVHTKKLISEVSVKEKDVFALEEEIREILNQKRKKRNNEHINSEDEQPGDEQNKPVNSHENLLKTRITENSKQPKRRNNLQLNSNDTKVSECDNLSNSELPSSTYMTRSKRTYSTVVQNANK